jgi:hypothetical protein
VYTGWGVFEITKYVGLKSVSWQLIFSVVVSSETTFVPGAHSCRTCEKYDAILGYSEVLKTPKSFKKKSQLIYPPYEG